MDEETRRMLEGFVQRYEAARRQENAYEQLRKEGGLSFAAAVEVAAVRMRDALQPKLEGPVAVFSSGLLGYYDYLPENRDPQNADIDRLIQAAESDYYAFTVLKLIAQMFVVDDHLPSLKIMKTKLTMELVTAPKRPSGPHRYAKLHRDTMVAKEISRLVGAGFLATRNKAAGSGTSACDVIVEALARHTGHSGTAAALSYDAVEAIWARRESLKTPKILKEAFEQTFGQE